MNIAVSTASPGAARLMSIGGDGRRVWCDAEGVFIGPGVPLVERQTGTGEDARLAPIPADHLEKVLSGGYGRRVDVSRLLPGLTRVAGFIEKGDLALAGIALAHLRIPPFETAQHGQVAWLLDSLLKGDWDPDKHPRTGRAPNPGWFAPKDEGSATDQDSAPTGADRKALATAAEQARNLAVRRAVRALARNVLEIGGELILDAVPIVDIAAGALTAYDVYQTLDDLHQLKIGIDALKEFVEGGPRTLDQLRVSADAIGFERFQDFKDQFGAAPNGYLYHHIIEQTANFPPEVIQNTDNIVLIPRLLHEEVNAEYEDTCDECGGLPLRQWLKTQPEETNRQWGLKVLRRVGILKNGVTR